MDDRYPHRIVCLTEEPTEVLYALGMEERIVGISNTVVYSIFEAMDLRTFWHIKADYCLSIHVNYFRREPESGV